MMDPFQLNALPTEMTIGGVTYEILSFHEEGEDSVGSGVMIERAKKLGAHMGKDELEYLLTNQADIPATFRGKVVFVFTNEPCVYYIFWDFDLWYKDGICVASDWFRNYRVLRRK